MKILTRTMLFVAFASITQSVVAQDKPYQPADPQLYRTIAHMDSILFDAFNTHNIETMKALFAPNLEFYHDRGGLQDYTTVINNFKQVFAATPGLRRELVPGTLEVYPIPGYGAIEIGMHRFVHEENGQTQIGLYRFVHTWQLKNGQWQITRVVSVGH